MLRHHRSNKFHSSSNLLKSTPDLSIEPKGSDSIKSSRSNWRTSSATTPHRCSPDGSPGGGRPRTASPHHSRALSFRNMKRPTPQQMQCEELGYNPTVATSFRPRGSTMPSDSASYYLARRRMRSKVMYNSRNLTPSPPVHDPGDEEDDEYYLCRSFSINSKGGIVNRGDFIRQRSRSNNSVASSTASSKTTPTGNASTATSYSSGGRGPSSRVQILGGASVGKTALINQFMNSEYMNYETQDEDFEKCVSVLLDGIEYELIFLDNPLPLDNMVLEAMSEEADAYIVTYAVTERSTFEKAVDILFSFRERGIMNTKAVILVGNKSDLARTREVAVEEGKSIACSYECKFIETSAAINHNVDELLVGMVSQIRLKHRQKEESSKKTTPSSSPSASPFKKRGGGSVKGSLRSSLRTKGIINRLLGKSGRSKSCEDLHVL